MKALCLSLKVEFWEHWPDHTGMFYMHKICCIINCMKLTMIEAEFVTEIHLEVCAALLCPFLRNIWSWREYLMRLQRMLLFADTTFILKQRTWRTFIMWAALWNVHFLQSPEKKAHLKLEWEGTGLNGKDLFLPFWFLPAFNIVIVSSILTFASIWYRHYCINQNYNHWWLASQPTHSQTVWTEVDEKVIMLEMLLNLFFLVDVPWCCQPQLMDMVALFLSAMAST